MLFIHTIERNTFPKIRKHHITPNKRLLLDKGHALAPKAKHFLIYSMSKNLGIYAICTFSEIFGHILYRATAIRDMQKEEKMDIREVFKDAREKETYNKFYALGKVQGIGTDDFGRKHFILFVRGSQDIPRAGRRRDDTKTLRDENTKIKDIVVRQNECMQTLLDRLDNYGGLDRESQDYIKLTELIREAQDATAAKENSDEKKKSDPPQETYLSIEYGNTSMPSDTRINDMVEVVGHINGYFYQKDTWKKDGYIIQLVADEIRPAEPILEQLYGLKGFSTERPSTFVVLKGNVLKRITMNGWIRLLLRVDEKTPGRRPSSIWAQYTYRMRVNDIKAKEGMTVGLYGIFTTTRKEIRTEDSTEGLSASAVGSVQPQYKRFTNIIVEDMNIVGAPEEKKLATGFGNFGESEETKKQPEKKRE